MLNHMINLLKYFQYIENFGCGYEVLIIIIFSLPLFSSSNTQYLIYPTYFKDILN